MTTDTQDEPVSATISEATFLVTELRYTLGQIHVQIGDLDEETRRTVKCGDRSVADTLAEMQQTEDRYQEEYGRILGIDVSTLEPAEQVVPLPINEEQQEASTEQETFEHNRAQTIAMLESAGESWPSELMELVRKHVMDDRRFTTALAECRKTYFEMDNRPDLDEPLTETEPEVIREPSPAPGSVHLASTSE